MFGSCTRLMALIAVVTHVWVSLIAAPWHQLSAHLLPALRSECRNEASAPRRCNCRHHAHGKTATAQNSSHDSAPAEDEDHCATCQALAQPFAQPEVAVAAVTEQSLQFPPSIATIQPLLGVSIDPVSRGPPNA